MGVAKTMMTDMFGKSMSTVSCADVSALFHGLIGVGPNGFVVPAVICVSVLVTSCIELLFIQKYFSFAQV
jgi:hypothetical protein